MFLVLLLLNGTRTYRVFMLQGFFGKGFLSRSKPEYEVISNISQKAFSKSEKLRRCKCRELLILIDHFIDYYNIPYYRKLTLHEINANR